MGLIEGVKVVVSTGTEDEVIVGLWIGSLVTASEVSVPAALFLQSQIR